MQRMNKKSYSESWNIESNLFQQKGIYESLANELPVERTLEIGCGSGWSTIALAKSRDVLSIDNNEYLLTIAKANVEQANAKASFLLADVFDFSDDDFRKISSFSPVNIVCWFIGSHADDHDKNLDFTMPSERRVEAYREMVQSILFYEEICTASVQCVHFVDRISLDTNANFTEVIEDEEIYQNEKFNEYGFEVAAIKILDWDRTGSNFTYISKNPNRINTNSHQTKIESVILKRLRKPVQSFRD